MVCQFAFLDTCTVVRDQQPTIWECPPHLYTAVFPLKSHKSDLCITEEKKGQSQQSYRLIITFGEVTLISEQYSFVGVVIHLHTAMNNPS